MELDNLVCLGIETTAHTFGVSIVRGKKVLCNEKKAFSTEEGGMIPAEVADHHVRIFDEVFINALTKANIPIEDVDLIAFSASPGIGHSLRIGAFFARTLSLRLKKPLIPVNHCIAHLEVGRIMTGAEDPILLYASGANTQIIGYEAKKYRVFGETLDIGVGNFLDSLGRVLGLGFPAGPKIEGLAKKGKYIKLPYTVKGMDISLGGLLTNLKHKIKENKYSVEDICFSVQETVFAMLTEVTERALAHTDKKQVILGGGVACNKRLQEMVRLMCDERGAKSFVVENQFLVDNAAMIALTGVLIYSFEKRDLFNESSINPYQRTDEVIINYRD
ncbi:tRNA (adenosine(37)-N6)-threonylcarbamoyltransferase complex transferase subunit TsaD [Candidatus Woesearchaeota archaeon]|nr:tRNA (adenosine(37)-N6)-threonylcarbamoyltransferase complex transferase subunit TsaD [Candidatus Woesearchaeota archaeon]